MFTLDGLSIHETTMPEKCRLETDAYILLYERSDTVADMEQHYFALLPVMSSNIPGSGLNGIFKHIELEHRRWKNELTPTDHHMVLWVLAQELSHCLLLKPHKAMFHYCFTEYMNSAL